MQQLNINTTAASVRVSMESDQRKPAVQGSSLDRARKHLLNYQRIPFAQLQSKTAVTSVLQTQPQGMTTTQQSQPTASSFASGATIFKTTAPQSSNGKMLSHSVKTSQNKLAETIQQLQSISPASKNPEATNSGAQFASLISNTLQNNPNASLIFLNQDRRAVFESNLKQMLEVQEDTRIDARNLAIRQQNETKVALQLLQQKTAQTAVKQQSSKVTAILSKQESSSMSPRVPPQNTTTQKFQKLAPKLKPQNRIFTIRKDSFQVAPLANATNKEMATNSSTGGTVSFHGRSAVHEREAKQIQLFPRMTNKSVPTASNSSKNAANAAQSLQRAQILQKNQESKIITSHHGISSLNLSSAQIELDTDLRQFQMGHGSPSLGKKKQKLAHQRLSAQLEQQSPPTHDMKNSTPGLNDDLMPLTSEAGPGSTGGFALDHMSAYQNILPHAVVDHRRVLETPDDDLTELRNRSSINMSKNSMTENGTGCMSSLNQQVAQLMERKEDSASVTGKLVNMVTLGKALNKDYQVQITSYSRRESQTHEAMISAENSLTILQDQASPVQLPALRADRISQEIRSDHQSHKLQYMNKSPQIQRNLSGIGGPKTMQDAATPGSYKVYNGAKQKGKAVNTGGGTFGGSSAPASSNLENALINGQNKASSGATSIIQQRQKNNLAMGAHNNYMINAAGKRNSRQYNSLAIRSEAPSQAHSGKSSQYTTQIDSSQAMQSGETSLIQNYKHASGQMTKNSARRLAIVNQNNTYSAKQDQHKQSQEKLFQITMPMISTSKFDEDSLNAGTQQMDTSHAVKMTQNMHSQSNCYGDVESIDSQSIVTPNVQHKKATANRPAPAMPSAASAKPELGATAAFAPGKGNQRRQFLPNNSVQNHQQAQITAAKIGSSSGIIKGLLRDSLAKNRNESFKELMQFNLDTEFEKAERNLSMVNATQQFVNKALRGQIQTKRSMKLKQLSHVEMPVAATDNTSQTQQNTSQFAPNSTTANTQAGQDTRVVQTTGGALKTSIKSSTNAQTTTFKGINIMSMEDGKGLKFIDQTKARKVKFDV